MTIDKLLEKQPKHLIVEDSSGNKVEVAYFGDNLESAMGLAHEILNKKESESNE